MWWFSRTEVSLSGRGVAAGTMRQAHGNPGTDAREIAWPVVYRERIGKGQIIAQIIARGSRVVMRKLLVSPCGNRRGRFCVRPPPGRAG